MDRTPPPSPRPPRPRHLGAPLPLAGLLALALAAGLPGVATAGPPAGLDARMALHKAFVHNLALKSYRATMTDLKTNRKVAVVEFQAPDRYRMTVTGQPPTVIIGNTMYMTHDGKTMTVPLPKGMLGQFRNESTISDLEKGSVVRALGPGMVGAEPAMKYAFDSVQGSGQNSSTAWIGVRSNHVLMVETTGRANGRSNSMRVAYTDFDSPAIRIAPPN